MNCCKIGSQKPKQNNKSIQKAIRGKKGVAKSILIFGLAPLVLIAGILFWYSTKSSAPSEKSPKVEEKSPKVEKLKFSQAVGKEAPDFILPDFDGKTIKMSDYKGKIVVLFFTEGAMCYPACWDQILAFEKDERFNANDVVALSIVVDEKSEWQKVIKQVPEFSKAKILFDSNRKISTIYDVLSLKSSMHPPSAMHPDGYPGHTYFLIDKEGIVRFTFDDSNMGIRNDLLISELSKLGG